jgi:PilZ domain
MELSAPQFLQVLSEVAGPRPVSERRHSPRIVAEATLPIAPVFAGRRSAPIVAQLHDLGRGGLGLVLPAPMAVGTHFIAYLPRPDSNPLEVRCEVCQCHKVKADGFIIGAEFQRFSLAIPVRAQFEGRPPMPTPAKTPLPTPKLAA